MTVAELIDELQQYQPYLPVLADGMEINLLRQTNMHGKIGPVLNLMLGDDLYDREQQ